MFISIFLSATNMEVFVFGVSTAHYTIEQVCKFVKTADRVRSLKLKLQTLGESLGCDGDKKM